MSSTDCLELPSANQVQNDLFLTYQRQIAEIRNKIKIVISKNSKEDSEDSDLILAPTYLAYMIDPQGFSLTSQNIQSSIKQTQETCILIHKYPTNEMLISAFTDYSGFNSDLNNLNDNINALNYDQKVTALNKALLQTSDQLAYYIFEIIADGHLGLVINNSNGLKATHQAYDPKLGYDVPKVLEVLEIADLYENIYDLAVDTYSQLIKLNYPHPEFICLFGHKRRTLIKIQLSELLEFIDKLKRYDNTSIIGKEIITALGTHHPLVAESFAF